MVHFKDSSCFMCIRHLTVNTTSDSIVEESQTFLILKDGHFDTKNVKIRLHVIFFINNL